MTRHPKGAEVPTAALRANLRKALTKSTSNQLIYYRHNDCAVLPLVGL